MLGESTLSTQKDGRRIAMTSEELDAFLGQQRTGRLASVSASGEPHGVELRGRVEPVGDIPRLGESALPELETPERLFGAKYIGTPDGAMYHDKRHAWLRLKPEKIASWDFRKTGR
jgi:hypothetical protein